MDGLKTVNLSVFSHKTKASKGSKNNLKSSNMFIKAVFKVQLVSEELNHLAAILHVYAGGLNFMKLLFFKKKMEILLHF